MSNATNLSGQFILILTELSSGPADAIEESFNLVTTGTPTTSI